MEAKSSHRSRIMQYGSFGHWCLLMAQGHLGPELAPGTRCLMGSPAQEECDRSVQSTNTAAVRTRGAFSPRRRQLEILSALLPAQPGVTHRRPCKPNPKHRPLPSSVCLRPPADSWTSHMSENMQLPLPWARRPSSHSKESKSSLEKGLLLSAELHPEDVEDSPMLTAATSS